MEKDLQHLLTQYTIDQTNQILKVQQLLSDKIERLKEIYIFDWQIFIGERIVNELVSTYYGILNDISNPENPKIYSIEFSNFLNLDQQFSHTISKFHVSIHKYPELWKNCDEIHEEDWITMDNGDPETQKIIGVALFEALPAIISSSGEYLKSSIALNIDSENPSLEFNYP